MGLVSEEEDGAEEGTGSSWGEGLSGGGLVGMSNRA